MLDANVLISYLLTADQQSPVVEIVEAVARGELMLLFPAELLDELARRVPSKPYLAGRIATEDLMQLTSLLSELSEPIPTLTEPIPPLTRDPKDDYLIAYAVVCEADYLVTGDADLLALHQIGDLRIVSPREFVALQGGSTAR